MPEVPSDAPVNISPQAGTPDVRVKNWVKANSTHHSGVLDLLFATLGAKEEPRFLQNVFEEIRDAAGLLCGWRDAGVNTFGLAGFAEVSRSNPAFLELSGAHRRTEHSVASAFGQKTGHLYLYKMLSARHSYLHSDSHEHQSWSRVFRIWILIQALDRARKSNLNDGLLQEVCDSLRKAAEETDGEDWLPVTDLLKTNKRGFDQISLHLAFTATRLSGTAIDQQFAPKHIKFLKALLGVARGRSDSLREISVASAAETTGDASDFGDESEDQSSPEIDTDELPFAPFLTNTDDDEDLAALASDPEKSIQAQDAGANQLHLLLGAEARYVVWGWQKVNPLERQELNDLIAMTYQSGDSKFQLISAYVEISLKLGLSLKRTLNTPCGIGRLAKENWSIDLKSMTALKQPPRRPTHWNPESHELSLIRSVAVSFAVPLSENCGRALAKAAESSLHVSRLQDLWPHGAGPVTVQFALWVEARPTLSRLSPSMLSGALGQDLYEKSGDPVFARLFSASSYKGLPASTAYTAYRSEDLASQLGQCVVAAECNVGGSLMDPVTDILEEAFRKLQGQLVEKVQANDPIEFHNLLAIHWDAVYRATTGVRPNLDIWKSTGIFDWVEYFAIFNEKLSPLQSSARLVPLLTKVADSFRKQYLINHLPALANWLKHHGHEDHANEILAIAEGRTTSFPGFLFLLNRKRDDLEVAPIDGSARKKYQAPGYPLPWNVFRHWLRTQCHRLALNVELIDSFIGHSDGATLTHGDFSDRVWRDDAIAARNAIGRAYASLQVRDPPIFDWNRAGVDGKSLTADTDQLSAFDTTLELEAQAEQRQAAHGWRLQLKAARQARSVIAAFLIANSDNESPRDQRITTDFLSKGLSALAANKTSELSARLIRDRRTSPEMLGQFRYAYFLWLIQRAWDRHGLHTKLERRYHRAAKDASHYRTIAIGSLDRFQRFERHLNAVFVTVTPSKLANFDAYCLAALDLCISTRSADLALLDRLLNPQGFRIITFQSQHYLEWNYEETLEFSHAVQRLRISSRTAHLLRQIQSAKKSFCTKASPVPYSIEILSKLLVQQQPGLQRCSALQLFSAACALTDQRNVIELPGTLAALLSGRVKSASLPWQDWLAFKRLPRTRLPAITLTDKPRVIDGDEPTEPLQKGFSLPVAVKKQTTKPLEGRQQVRKLLKVVHKHLNSFIERGLEKDGSPNERRDLKARLLKEVRSFEGLVPPVFHMLCVWSIALFKRDYIQRKRELTISSIRRYFDALASKVAALAETQDLRHMREDEIINFYTVILSIRSKEKSIYVYRRLKDFHRFVVKQFHVIPINWGEIAFEAAEELCSPGYVEEQLYQLILQYVNDDASLSYRVRTCTQALAIFAYRFGLREDEAMGMFRDDWIDLKDFQFVIVRRDTLRGLKTTAARRQVPLVFHLSDLEHQILINLKTQWREFSKGLLNVPLFCDPENPKTILDATPIYSYLNDAIQLVSGTTHLSIHKLRHSFGARVWDALQTHNQLELVSWRLNDAAMRLHIRKILLGTRDLHGTTRRSPWVLAALMGHTHPLHSAFSYVHMQSDCAEVVAFKAPEKDWERKTGNLIIDLDSLEEHAYERPTQPAVARAILPRDVLNVAGMLADESPILTIAGSLKLPVGFVSAVDLVFTDVYDRLTTKPRKGRPNKRRPKKGVTQGTAMSIRGEAATEVSTAVRNHRNKSGSTGLLSHILASDRPLISKRLGETFASTSALGKYAGTDIVLEQFVAMFGPRRLVSMWSKGQFAFVHCILSDLGVKKSSLKLGAPSELSSRVRGLGESAGLIETTATREGAYSLPIDASFRLDKVSCQDGELVVTSRVALLLEEDTDQHVKNRYQLILYLLCVYLACHWKTLKLEQTST